MRGTAVHANSPGAYLLSAGLHALVALLILLLGYVASQTQPDTSKVFELVAGRGDNYGATEAPALGVPGGAKIAAPDLPPAPVAEAPPPPVVVAEATPAPTPKAPATTQTPNFAKTFEKTANRKAARLEAQYKKQLEKQAALEKAEAKKRETYDQYLKEHGGKAGVSQSAPSKVPKIDAEGIEGGVSGGSTANKTGGAGGKALSRGDQDLLDSYFAMLRARLRENHVPPPDVSDRLSTRVEFFVSANGLISGVRIIQSSGNRDFDASVKEAFAHTTMPPRPDHKGDMATLTFKMRDDE